jgi:hypothetical protein
MYTVMQGLLIVCLWSACIAITGILGMILGSLCDRGFREEGRISNDLPSTIGMFVGVAVGTLLFVSIV